MTTQSQQAALLASVLLMLEYAPLGPVLSVDAQLADAAIEEVRRHEGQ